jgi:hypothetical protein
MPGPFNFPLDPNDPQGWLGGYGVPSGSSLPFNYWSLLLRPAADRRLGNGLFNSPLPLGSWPGAPLATSSFPDPFSQWPLSLPSFGNAQTPTVLSGPSNTAFPSQPHARRAGVDDAQRASGMSSNNGFVSGAAEADTDFGEDDPVVAPAPAENLNRFGYAPPNRAVQPSTAGAPVGASSWASDRWPDSAASGASTSSEEFVPASYQGVGRPRPWWGPPGPQDIIDLWADQYQKGIQGLINFLRSRGGSRSPRRDDDEDCYDRWERERARCDAMWRLKDTGWASTCKDRADERYSLCVRNGGRPDPNEPREFDWNDIPPEERRRWR